ATVQVQEVGAPDRAERVRRREQRYGVLADPGEPVQVALVARALLRCARPGLLAALGDALGATRVVGADVEQAVQLVEGGREVGGRGPEVSRRGAQVALERLCRADERTHLLLEDRRRLLDERQDRGARVVEPAGRRG